VAIPEIMTAPVSTAKAETPSQPEAKPDGRKRGRKRNRLNEIALELWNEGKDLKEIKLQVLSRVPTHTKRFVQQRSQIWARVYDSLRKARAKNKKADQLTSL
jgi:hypothetical protein